MPLIRDVLDKYFITHKPEQSQSNASDVGRWSGSRVCIFW